MFCLQYLNDLIYYAYKRGCTNMKKNNKSWYEKVGIWIGIAAGVMTVIVGIITIANKNQTTNENINNLGGNTKTTNIGDMVINFGDNNNFTKELSDNNKISENNININDLQLNYATLSDNRFKNVYIGQYTDLSNPKEKYYLENNCAFILNISNPTEHQIKISNFKIVAEDIIQISEPYISITLNMSESIDLLISNHGWSDAYNIELEISDENGILSEYFNKKDLMIEVPELESGSFLLVHFLNEDKMIKSPNIDQNNFFTVKPFVNITMENGEKYSQNLLPIYLYNDKVEIDIFGGNEGFYGVYGIMVDTSKSEFQKDFNVNETVNAGEILDIPICFFPNKSCYMDFYIEFTIFNGSNEEIISSDLKNIEFNVSSIDAKYINLDNCIVDLQSIYSNSDGRYYISYPDNKKLNPLNSQEF